MMFGWLISSSFYLDSFGYANNYSDRDRSATVNFSQYLYSTFNVDLFRATMSRLCLARWSNVW